MKEYKCDRCKKELNNSTIMSHNTNHEITIKANRVIFLFEPYVTNEARYNFCEDCMKVMAKILNRFHREADNPGNLLYCYGVSE